MNVETFMNKVHEFKLSHNIFEIYCKLYKLQNFNQRDNILPVCNKIKKMSLHITSSKLLIAR